MKPTRWLSSAPAILRRLGRQCPNSKGAKVGHKHMILLGHDKTDKAAEYPPELCREILRGVQDQLQLEAQKWKGFIGHVGISQQPVYDLGKEGRRG